MRGYGEPVSECTGDYDDCAKDRQSERDWATNPPTQEEVNRSAGKMPGHPDYIPLSVLVANNRDASEFSEDD